MDDVVARMRDLATNRGDASRRSRRERASLKATFRGLCLAVEVRARAQYGAGSRSDVHPWRMPPMPHACIKLKTQSCNLGLQALWQPCNQMPTNGERCGAAQLAAWQCLAAARSARSRMLWLPSDALLSW